MSETQKIQAAMGLILDPEHLRMPFQELYDGIGEGTRDAEQEPAMYGYHLWNALMKRHAHIPALDQSIDRLPAAAFGRVPPSSHLTALAKAWATFGAPNIYSAYIVLKGILLWAGWKPSEINGYLVTSLRLEEATMGQPYMATTAPDFAELDTSLLNPREKRVVMVMSGSSAFS